MEWNRVKKEFLTSRNSIEIFEKDKVTDNNSTVMEAIVHNTDSIVINRYLRLLGTGQSLYENIFSFNLEVEKIFGEKNYIVAYDAFGGLFATKGTIHYFAPDTLAWEDLEINCDEFIMWLLSENLREFYSSFLWDKSGDTISNLKLGEGILIYPYLWAKECDINAAVKKLVPFKELLEMNAKFYKSFKPLSKDMLGSKSGGNK